MKYSDVKELVTLGHFAEFFATNLLAREDYERKILFSE
jgi:hypothetical protein